MIGSASMSDSTKCSASRIPMIRMPVAPGRNVAILVEVAARNQLLRARGHHAARRLVDRLNEQLASPPPRTSIRGRGSVMREKRHAARRAARTAVTSRFVVLTGLSGSGKSQAIRALEDLGYFCVDNLPVSLLPMLAELTLRAGTEISRAAVVVDVREGQDAQGVSGHLPEAEEPQEPQSGADLPRGGGADAGAAIQRDAPAASAVARSIGDRGHPRRARGDAADSRSWPITSSTRPR